jgi:hypothetical protein
MEEAIPTTVYHSKPSRTSLVSNGYDSNRPPWALLATCMFVGAILLLLLRFLYAAENKRRDAEPRDETYDEVYISGDSEKGGKKVDKVKRFLSSSRLC